MFKNYLKIALRSIKKQKAYSLINIIGLTVGIAVFLLIGLYVKHELSFDRYHENASQIYRVVRGENNNIETGYSTTSPPLAAALKKEIPDFVQTARIANVENILVSHNEKHFAEDKLFWADNEIFDIFSFDFLKGNKSTALSDPLGVVITESTARKYFGDADPLGKTLSINWGADFTVSAVVEDMPANSHFSMDLIAPIQKFFQVTGNDESKWTSNYVYTYALLHEDANPTLVENKIGEFENKYFSGYFEDKVPRFFYLQAITEIHLHSHRRQELEANSDFKGVLIYLTAGILILLIACINYINLTTAKSSERFKEVGMRKVLGAKKVHLLKQFMGESFVMAFIAMLLSFGVVQTTLPGFNSLMKTQLSLNLIDQPEIILYLLLLALTVGLLAGFFPSRIISGMKPLGILNRVGFSGKERHVFSTRNVLVVMQFSVSVILIILTIGVGKQLEFIQGKDMGYSKEQIVTVKSIDGSIRKNIQSIKNELLKHPNILNVAASESLPHNISNSTVPDWLCFADGSCTSTYYNEADYDFLDLYGIDIVEGRNFSRDFASDRNGVFIVNEALVKTGIWENPIGQEIDHWNGAKGKVVGVFKDFHSQSLHSEIAPLYIYLSEANFSNISVKVGAGNISSTIAYIENTFRQFSPDMPFQYSFFDEEFEQVYKTEQRQGKIYSYFSYIAIMISCLGLFGLATYIAEKRRKEIGVRKVNGAKVSEVLIMLNKDFIKWVLIAFIIATPVAYYAMNKWLENFAYKTTLSWWVFALAGFMALAIALLTVSWQSWKAATRNPVEALRYE